MENCFNCKAKSLTFFAVVNDGTNVGLSNITIMNTFEWINWLSHLEMVATNSFFCILRFPGEYGRKRCWKT